MVTITFWLLAQVTQVWNDTRVSKLWQNFYFGGNYYFNPNTRACQHHQLLLLMSPVVCRCCSVLTVKQQPGPSADPRHLGALRRTGSSTRGCVCERMDETHLSVFRSISNRARGKCTSLPRLCTLSTSFLIKIKTYLRARGPSGVSGALHSLYILRIGRIGSAWASVGQAKLRQTN